MDVIRSARASIESFTCQLNTLTIFSYYPSKSWCFRLLLICNYYLSRRESKSVFSIQHFMIIGFNNRYWLEKRCDSNKTVIQLGQSFSWQVKPSKVTECGVISAPPPAQRHLFPPLFPHHPPTSVSPLIIHSLSYFTLGINRISNGSPD